MFAGCCPPPRPLSLVALGALGLHLSPFLNLFFKLEGSCFTMCWFLLHSNGASHNCTCIYIYTPSLLNLCPSPHPGSSLSPRLAPVLYGRSPPAACRTRGRVSISLLRSRLVSPSLAASTGPLSTSASPALPCKQLPQCCFSRFHICALIYHICLSLSGLLHTV